MCYLSRLKETERVERGQFVQDLLLSTLSMEGVDLNEDFVRTLVDDGHSFSGKTAEVSFCRCMGRGVPVVSGRIFFADGINSVGDYNSSPGGCRRRLCVCPHFFSGFTMG